MMVGDIYSGPSPLDDTATGKPKRFLIVSEPSPDGDLMALVGSFSRDKSDERWQVPVNHDDLEEGVIDQELFFSCCKRVSISRRWLQGRIGRVKTACIDRALRLVTFFDVETYYHSIHKPSQENPFASNEGRIPYGGRVYDENEMRNLVDSSLDFWLTAGRYSAAFEDSFARFLGVGHCSLTNSGSSANLLAFMALTSPKLGNRRIQKGDEVITVAAGFPTTVAPILQYGAVPTFVDIDIPTYNIDCEQLEKAVSKRTKAVILAHTLGNPFDLDRVFLFCQKHDLWLVEDCCDALGSIYLSKNASPSEAEQSLSITRPNPSTSPLLPERTARYCGTFGHLSTFSFYPPHQITMGEGGAVCTNDITLKRIVESLRDWGRDCWCPSGHDNTCRMRFSQKFGALPRGYDHKYVYSHFGYNLRVTDLQAAVGCAQLQKLPTFIEARNRNWRILRSALSELSSYIILPEATPYSDPCWFGFPLTLRKNTGFTRSEIVSHLECARIQTRVLFAGNLIKHPCFDEMRKAGRGFRVVGRLLNTDKIMKDTFWIGVYPGLSEAHLKYVANSVKSFLRRNLARP